MARTALLIGSQTHGLSGVEHDVETMAEVLEARHFKVVPAVGADATRAAILDGFERLIRDTRFGDTVVFYYSGHGGIAVAPVPAGSRRSAPRLHFFVPTDFDDSTPADFRGITEPEMSVLLARLTWATPNATVIIDACHAAHSMRDQTLPKALYQYTYLDVSEHLDRMRRNGLDPSVRDVLGNPDAVRLMACGRDQSAYEYTNQHGRRIGLFTESVATELRQADRQPATWATLIERVRRRVSSVVPYQRPEAEGPSLRLPFQTTVSYPSARQATLGRDAGPLGADVGIEWGRAVDGRRCPLPFEGAVVQAGERIYVSVHNRSTATVYVSLILVEEFARVSLITSLNPSGIALGPGEEQTVGDDDLDGRLVGFGLRWPDGVGRGDALLRTVAVLVGSGPLDMSGVQRPAAEPRSRAEIDRDVEPLGADQIPRRDVHPITFRLAPRPH